MSEQTIKSPGDLTQYQDKPVSCVLNLILEKNPCIQSFSAVEYIDPPSIQERIPDIEKAPMFKQGVLLREKTSIPFWDCVLAQAFHEAAWPVSVIGEALFHNGRPELLHPITAKDAEKHLTALISRDWKLSTLALASKVILKGGKECHIPMLDFHIPPNPTSYQNVVECLNSLNAGQFAIVDSGKSFHAYGLTLLEEDGLATFLSRSLLLSPIVDPRYIAHQLLDKRCKLRIVSTPRKPKEPKLLGTT